MIDIHDACGIISGGRLGKRDVGLLTMPFAGGVGILGENEAISVRGWRGLLRAGTAGGRGLGGGGGLGWRGGGGGWVVGLALLAQLLAFGFRREGFLAHLE